MDKSINMSDTVQLPVFICGINMEFNITEELAALMPRKGTATEGDLYEVWISQYRNWTDW
jgi:hypothetical protein